MSEQHRPLDEERRLRRAALAAAAQSPPDPEDPGGTDEEDGDAPAHRMEQQALWVDLQIRRAMERGEFDDLPGAAHDPNWWVKGLIEREQITGVLPPALGLRREDAELDVVLDRETTEEGVRGAVDDFNARVVEARRQLLGGPPVVTATRDVEAEVVAWHARRAARRDEVRRQREHLNPPASAPARPARPRRWWPRRSPRPRAE